ncbi:hypothetical protein GCM10027073_68320 [Streptomyces chlorus]
MQGDTAPSDGLSTGALHRTPSLARPAQQGSRAGDLWVGAPNWKSGKAGSQNATPPLK